MVQEFAVGGELFAQLRNAGRFDTASSRFYSAHVILVFEYLHKHGIIYRNLKPENLLLGKEGYVKLTEFSLAKHVAFKTCDTGVSIVSNQHFFLKEAPGIHFVGLMSTLPLRCYSTRDMEKASIGGL